MVDGTYSSLLPIPHNWGRYVHETELPRLVRRRTKKKVTFSSLGLRKPILGGVRKAGYETPSEIQELAAKRWNARQERDWETADSIREELRDRGWQVNDRSDGFDLEPI